ncbi:C3HC4 finger protein [Aspergillus lucknowensis]|uniref:RING-type domain-containing protein n=1 Tax=Aspergillus lucknowensis TaxID=176173 RepID=A0ABR4LUG5_9EURO
MNSDFRQSALHESEFHNDAASTLPDSSPYISFTQPFDPASHYGFVSPASNEQGFAIEQYEQGPDSHSMMLNLDGMVPAYSTVPFTSSQNQGNAPTLYDNPSFPSFANFGMFENPPPQWPGFTQQTTNQPVFGASVPVLTQPLESQLLPFGYQPFRSPLPSQSTAFSVGQSLNATQRPPTQTAVVSNTQTGLSTGTPTAAGVGEIPGQSHNTVVTSLPAPSPGSRHQRRHHRANSHQRARSNTQFSRARARPPSIARDTLNTNAMNQPQLSPQISEDQSRSVSTLPPTVTASSRSESQRARLNAYLRSMRPSDVHAMYEESLARRFQGSPPWVAKKGLDVPQEDRPEPKETEELTVNMECKVCMAQLIDTVLLPCGHAILCRWCADQQFPLTRGFLKPKMPCPMCRETVRQRHRIYFP